MQVKHRGHPQQTQIGVGVEVGEQRNDSSQQKIYLFGLGNINLMSFREKFEGKINTVNKKGLKHTLFENNFIVKSNKNPAHHYTYSHSKQPQEEDRELQLQRRSTFGEINPKKESHIFSFQSQPLIEKNQNNRKPSSMFLDEMLDKHKNLLRIIDKKTSYKIARSK